MFNLLENTWVGELREFLKGRKTYSLAVALAVFTGLEVAGVDVPPWVIKALVYVGLPSTLSAKFARIEGALESDEG